MPGQVAEAMLLENDAARLRAVYQGKLSADQISANVQRLSEPGVLTAALNWYRALDLDARIGPIRVSTLYIWGDQDIALGRTAPETTQRYVMEQYHFEVLPGFPIGFKTKHRKQSEISLPNTSAVDRLETARSARHRKLRGALRSQHGPKKNRKRVMIGRGFTICGEPSWQKNSLFLL